MYKSNNFNFKKGNPYASHDEYEAAQAEEARANAEYEAMCDEAVSWIAKSGQGIEVFVDGQCLSLSIDGHAPKIVEFGPVSESAKAQGIVARLGNVGVTAEQMAAIKEKMGK